MCTTAITFEDNMQISDEAKDLILTLLSNRPEDRKVFGAKKSFDIKQHEWFTDDGVEWNDIL